MPLIRILAVALCLPLISFFNCSQCDEQAGYQEIRRYPTMRSPKVVQAAEAFEVSVSLTQELLSGDVEIELGTRTGEGQLAIVLPLAASWPIEVLLSADGAEVEVESQIMTLPREGDSEAALFRVRSAPLPEGRNWREMTVYATLWFEKAFLGKISRRVLVRRSLDTPVPQRYLETEHLIYAQSKPLAFALGEHLYLPPVGRERLSPAPQGPACGRSRRDRPREPGAPRKADLTIILDDRGEHEGVENATLHLMSPWLAPQADEFPRRVDLRDWIEARYAAFASFTPRGAKAVTPREPPLTSRTPPLLRGFGRRLFAETPARFKESFWHLYDLKGSDFRTIQIVTYNPYFPWELVLPYRKGAQGEEQLDFLGIDFQIARWHISESGASLARPPQRVQISRLALIAPQYSGGFALPAVPAEVESLKKHWSGEFEHLGGGLDAFQWVKSTFRPGIIHFAGHGTVHSVRDGVFEYALKLEGDTQLDVLTWNGFERDPRPEGHPVFFFNACEVGKADRVADFVAGWGPAVLDAGAGGYIGGLWPIGDRGAAEFAGRFYEHLFRTIRETGSANVAASLSETRRHFYQNGDPTFLGYSYFGDPLLELHR